MSLSNPFFTLLVLLYADVCHVPNHIFLYLKIHRGAVFTQYLSSNNPVQLLVCRPTLAKIYIIIIITINVQVLELRVGTVILQ